MTKPTGKQNALKHGGAGALNNIEEGKPFIGIAAARLDEVETTYSLDGPGALILRNANRLQVVSELYYDAIQKAAQDGDIARMDALIKTWGWVTNSSVRNYALVMAELRRDKDGGRALDAAEVLKEYKQKGGEDAPNSQVCE